MNCGTAGRVGEYVEANGWLEFWCFGGGKNNRGDNLVSWRGEDMEVAAVNLLTHRKNEVLNVAATHRGGVGKGKKPGKRATDINLFGVVPPDAQVLLGMGCGEGL